jgi:hypothetical protein
MDQERHTEILCRGCLQVIDPDTCGCGGSRKRHGSPLDEGHSFVPMGCTCLMQKETTVSGYVDPPDTKRIDWPFPWPRPDDIYGHNGPKAGVTCDVVVSGVLFSISPAKGEGFHTGRRRYHVLCEDCGDVLHNNTTGPPSYVRMHLEEKHGLKVRW